MTSWQTVLGQALFLLMGIGFISGVIKIWIGIREIKNGDQGLMDVVGGLLIPVARFIMYAIYVALGLGNAGFDPTKISGAGGGN